MTVTTLGVLGGLGPMSGICFCEMLTAHTRASCDQEHLNLLLSSRATTPDRTDYILGRSDLDPVPVMNREVDRLIRGGAELIAIPCNTAHFFYQRIAEHASVPVLNIIDLTAEFCHRQGFRRVGVLATEGTVRSGAYEVTLARYGLEYRTASEEEQAAVSHLIYGQIKQGLPPDVSHLLRIADRLREEGCDTVILGCTELSLLKRSGALGEGFVDSLEVLAAAAIRLCGKEPIGFEEGLMNFFPRKDVLHVSE